MNYRRHVENFQYFKSIVLFTLVVLLNSFSAGQAKACNYLRLQDCPIYLSCAITSTSTSNSRINKLSEFLTSEHRDLSTCNKKTKELEAKIKESFRSKSLVKRKEIQLRLRNLNFYYDKIDGLYGPNTFQGLVEFAAHGYLDTEENNQNDQANIVENVLEQIKFFPDLIPLFTDFNKIRKVNEIKTARQIYHGELLEDLPHGHGYIRYRDGTWYLGEWKNGKRHGRGLISFTDGSYYSGDWQVGLINGEGLISYPDKARYFGSVRNGIRDGSGVLELENRVRISDNWLDGKPTSVLQKKILQKYCTQSVLEGCSNADLCELAAQNAANKIQWPNSISGIMLQHEAATRDHKCFKGQLKSQPVAAKNSAQSKPAKQEITQVMPEDQNEILLEAENIVEKKENPTLKNPISTILNNPEKMLETITDERLISETVKELNQLLFMVINPEK